ncbi:hypothetical protein LY78DRAFT_79091 [Colletotrichum sublineola]|nr:hypothetical protein LY78DRAFT_79091 [Colletotrichum sublineola]
MVYQPLYPLYLPPIDPTETTTAARSCSWPCPWRLALVPEPGPSLCLVSTNSARTACAFRSICVPINRPSPTTYESLPPFVLGQHFFFRLSRSSRTASPFLPIVFLRDLSNRNKTHTCASFHVHINDKSNPALSALLFFVWSPADIRSALVIYARSSVQARNLQFRQAKPKPSICFFSPPPHQSSGTRQLGSRLVLDRTTLALR